MTSAERELVSSTRHPEAARALAFAAAMGLLVLLPVAMTVANKSAPLMLGIGAALANGAAVVSGSSAPLLRRYRDLALTGTGVLLVALAALAVLSQAWSIDPALTRRGLIEAMPELLFGWALAAAWPLVVIERDLPLLGAGLILAAALIVFEASAGMPLHHLVGARAEAYDLKRSAVPVVVLAWPALAFCAARGHRLWAAGIVGAALLAAIFAHSSASVVAVAAGVLVYVVAWLAPRVMLGAVAAAAFGLLIATPWAGTLADLALPAETRLLLRDQHASHRIAIWTAFEQHIRDRAVAGHGFNTSFRIADQIEGHDPAGNEVIDNIHPHNVLLQMWVEFGLVGAAGIAAALAFLVARMRAIPPRARAARLGFLTGAGVVSLVGLNAWAPWWLAVLALCLVCFGVVRDEPWASRRSGGPVS